MILLQRFPEKVVPNKHVVPNNCRELNTFWKKKAREGGRLFRNEQDMNEWEQYLVVLLYILTL